MFDLLLLHPQTRQTLEHFAQSPAHALMLTGPAGAGKETMARAVAAELLGLKTSEKLGSQAYFHELRVPKGKSAISIDQIRELQTSMTLKTIGNNETKRVAIIYGAEALQVPAQNALLKLLEEPPADSVLILTVTHEDAVLPTVRSRTQRLAIRPVSQEQATAYFNNTDQVLIKKAYLLSDGYVGLMHALVTEQQDHVLLQNIELSKQLLGLDRFERLAQLNQKTLSDKAEILSMLDALQRTSRAALKQAVQTHNQAATKRWHGIIKRLQTAETQLKHNTQTKLVLTNLFINL